MVRVAVPERSVTANGSGALLGLYDRYGLVVTNWHVVRDAAAALRQRNAEPVGDLLKGLVPVTVDEEVAHLGRVARGVQRTR